jgi:hypothetical protein
VSRQTKSILKVSLPRRVRVLTEQVTERRAHNITVVPITDTEYERRNTIAGATTNKVVDGTIVCWTLCIVCANEQIEWIQLQCTNCATTVFQLNATRRIAAQHHLDHANTFIRIVHTSRNNLVWSQTHIETGLEPCHTIAQNKTNTNEHHACAGRREKRTWCHRGMMRADKFYP